MNVLKRVALAVWSFVVGDDWRVALGVAIAIPGTALVARATAAWWVLPIAVIVLLADSLRRASGP